MRYWQGFIVALIAILVIVLIQNSLSGDQTSPQSETQSLLSSSGSEASSGSSGARSSCIWYERLVARSAWEAALTGGFLVNISTNLENPNAPPKFLYKTLENAIQIQAYPA